MYTSRCIQFICLAALLTQGVFAEEAVDEEILKQSAINAERKQNEYVRTKDFKSYEAALADNYMEINQGKTLLKKEALDALKETLKATTETDPKDYVMKNVKCNRLGYNTFMVIYELGSSTDNQVSVWTQENGAWKAKFYTFIPVQPTPPAVPATTTTAIPVPEEKK